MKRAYKFYNGETFVLDQVVETSLTAKGKLILCDNDDCLVPWETEVVINKNHVVYDYEFGGFKSQESVADTVPDSGDQDGSDHQSDVGDSKSDGVVKIGK